MNRHRCLALPLSALFLLLAACGPSEKPAGLLPEKERAPQFDRVSEFLDLGGVFYAYVDLTEETEKLATLLDEIVAEARSASADMPPVPLDFGKLFAVTGLAGMDAVGLSSRETGDGFFHNRSILFFPEGASGLFAVFGDRPRPFAALEMAPAGADFVYEANYRPVVLRDTLVEAAEALGGPFGRGTLVQQLDAERPVLGNRSINGIIEGLGDRMFVIVEFVDENEVPLDDRATFPEPRALLAVDGATTLLASLRPAVEKRDDLRWKDTADGFEIRSTESPPPPYGFLEPVLVADTAEDRVFLATSPAFLEACRQGGGLRDSDAFREAANLLPPEGVSLAYAAPGLVEPIRDLISRNWEEGQPGAPDFGNLLDLVLPALPKPVASVTTVGPEGLYTASNRNTSHRATMANFAVQPVAIAAAMAIPAFQKVRGNAREKTVLNNLRRIASGGQQHLLESGDPQVAYPELVGEYFPPLQPVAGEDYSDLVVRANGGTLRVTLANGEAVEYEY